MKNVPMKGIITPILTPMNPDETVNLEVLRQQIERLIQGGVHGIFPIGTNGEAYALSFDEKLAIIETCVDQVKGRVPVYAGTGCITTRETIELSKRAADLGADILSIITPSFAVASQKEMYDHYVEVAKHVDVPIVLYNIPARTGNKLLPETVAKLAKDVDVIMGAKDSSGDWDNLQAYIRLTQDLDKGFKVLSGNDSPDPEVPAGRRCRRHCWLLQRLPPCPVLYLQPVRGRQDRGSTGRSGFHRKLPCRVQVRQPQHRRQEGRCSAGQPRGRVPPSLLLPERRGH